MRFKLSPGCNVQANNLSILQVVCSKGFAGEKCLRSERVAPRSPQRSGCFKNSKLSRDLWSGQLMVV